MKSWFMIAVWLLPSLNAVAEVAKPKSPVLTLGAYLEQVKTNNPEARAAVESVIMAQTRLDEAEVPYSSEFYANYNLFGQRQEPIIRFNASQVEGRSWEFGVRDRNQYGLSSRVFMLSTRTNQLNMPPIALQFLNYTDFEQTQVGVELTQSLWRNSFGEADRAEIEGRRAISRLELLKAKFALKNLLLSAENTYWSVVSYNQIVRLQEENVERARKLTEWMSNKARLRLSDDVDALQTQASLEQRELELQSSIDERNEFIRQFNTLRGAKDDVVETLEELPTNEFLVKVVKDPSKRMTREDFQMIFEQAEATAKDAKAKTSSIAPKLDLVGSISGNGLEAITADAVNEAALGRNPNWAVGVQFSIPLDYSLIGDMRKSYAAQKRSAADNKERARYAEERTWDDLVKRNRDAQTRFEKSVNIEKILTSLVKRERQRLLDGRTTTFQTIQFEQNLALGQISRVRSQLGLLQIHNVMKQFEEQK